MNIETSIEMNIPVGTGMGVWAERAGDQFGGVDGVRGGELGPDWWAGGAGTQIGYDK